MTLANESINSEPIIKKIKEIIIREIDPDKIILFGSRAKNENYKNSDYDICVLKTGIENDKKNLIKKLYLSLFETRQAIDLILNTPEKFEILKFDKYLIFKNIHDNGQILYEKL